MEPLACLNGEIQPAAEAKISIWDRGFLFADSIYEVFRLYDGRLWLEAEHFGRLDRSLREMHFAEVNMERLRERILLTIQASGIREGTVYLQVSRGVAPRLHAFPDATVKPTELIVVRPYDDASTARLRETGVPVITYPDLRWGRCDVKSTNLLANVIANEMAHREGAYEAILVRDRIVTEATHSSLLWVRNGRLEATPEGPEILPGTTRRGLPEIVMRDGPQVHECQITIDELVACDEVVLTGTTIEVLPVIAVDGQLIGGGQPGPVARSLQENFRRGLAAWRASA